ncbi:MAG: flavodoxin family protein [Candidatus Altiarchaeales archaeon]|nr:flavodoxin family protein [Candidatus Altiarchaeales archaeon]
MALNEKQKRLCQENKTDYSDIKALYINCTLKKNPEKSHTQGLMDVSRAILAENKVDVENIRATDYDIPPGVWADMTEHGWAADDWPKIFKKITEKDILVLGTPIWLGEKSSVCSKIIERMYGQSAQENDKGQYIYYGKAGGCIITGNEDGIKHCGMGILYSLQHLGFTIPPQADSGWVGEAGPGPSYLDEKSGGLENDFTQRNVTFMSWNLLHMARALKDNGGIPAHGNQKKLWNAGCRFGHPNPEYR